MEKRIMLAAFLVLALYMVWMWLGGPKQKPADNPESKPAASATTAGATSSTASAPTSGPVAVGPSSPVGPHIVAAAPVAASDTFEIKNASVAFKFSSKGASIKSAVLREHDANPLKKGESKETAEKLEFIRAVPDQPSPLELSDEFTPDLALQTAAWTTTGPDATKESIAFSIEIADQASRYRLTKTFRLTKEPNRLAVDLTLEHLQGTEPLTKRFWLNTSGGCSAGEIAPQPVYHALVGTYVNGEQKLQTHVPGDILKQDGKRYDITTGEIRFACDMGVYFGAYLYCTTPKGCDRARLLANPLAGDVPASAYSQLGFLLVTNQPGEKKSIAFDFYVGPKDRRYIEKAYGPGEIHDAYAEVAHHELNQQGCFCYNLPVISSMVEGVSKLVLNAISFFGEKLKNMGVAIMLLVLCVRIIMFPFNRKSQVTMQRHAEKMNKVKPQLDKIKEKYKSDPQKLMSEQSKLMKENGISYFPIGGCLPAFFQMPVFFGLWSAIRFDIDLRHASFLWCNDLSQPDNLIRLSKSFTIPCCMPGSAPTFSGLNLLPLLMTAAWFFDTKTSMVKSDDPQIEQQQKMMQWMPLMFGVFMYGNAAGLSLYWLTNSVLAMIEKRIVKKFFPIKKDDAAPITVAKK